LQPADALPLSTVGGPPTTATTGHLPASPSTSRALLDHRGARRPLQSHQRPWNNPPHNHFHSAMCASLEAQASTSPAPPLPHRHPLRPTASRRGQTPPVSITFSRCQNGAPICLVLSGATTSTPCAAGSPKSSYRCCPCAMGVRSPASCYFGASPAGDLS
jgi:hypothetical protein